ncbi:MAG: hypothetical protein WCK49_02095 [Myxococcaceae bacterium]
MRKGLAVFVFLVSQVCMAQGDVIPCGVLAGTSCDTEELSASTLSQLRNWVSGETTYFDAYKGRFDVLFAGAIINTILTPLILLVSAEQKNGFLNIWKPSAGFIGAVLALAGTWRLSEVASWNSVEVLSGAAIVHSWFMSLANAVASSPSDNRVQTANMIAATGMELAAAGTVFWVYNNRVKDPSSYLPFELRVDRKASHFIDQYDLALSDRFDCCMFGLVSYVPLDPICWIESSPAKDN